LRILACLSDDSGGLAASLSAALDDEGLAVVVDLEGNGFGFVVGEGAIDSMNERDDKLKAMGLGVLEEKAEGLGLHGAFLCTLQATAGSLVPPVLLSFLAFGFLLFFLSPVLDSLSVSIGVGLVLHAVLSDGDDAFAVEFVTNVSAEDGFVVDHASVFAERFDAVVDEGRTDFCGDLFGGLGVGVDLDDFEQVSVWAFESLEVADLDFHG
jgi:hypothetical protein